jgi:thioredoxin
MRTPRKKGGLAGLKIPLLSDIHKSVSATYGTLAEEKGVALRGLFLIDGAGVLQNATINNLPVGRSVDEALRLVKAFQFVAEHGEVCPANWQPGEASMKANYSGSKEYFAHVPEEDAEFSKSVPSITSAAQLDELVASGRPLVIDFFAHWCGKCRQLAPKLDELIASHPGIAVYKVDTDAQSELAAKWKASGLPTFVFFSAGAEKARVTGYKPAVLVAEFDALAGR